jgi:hypothetical protein
MELEWYRDKHHVIVIGLFEDGSLINWAYLWGEKSGAGRWPRKRGSNTDSPKEKI